MKIGYYEIEKLFDSLYGYLYDKDYLEDYETSYQETLKAEKWCTANRGFIELLTKARGDYVVSDREVRAAYYLMQEPCIKEQYHIREPKD